MTSRLCWLCLHPHFFVAQRATCKNQTTDIPASRMAAAARAERSVSVPSMRKKAAVCMAASRVERGGLPGVPGGGEEGRSGSKLD